MEWIDLLSEVRLGKEKSQQTGDDIRSPFRKDFDRIAFSSAFRRLQDKTQVFPLSDCDYVRTRLTHSIEVASVGRSLGSIAWKNMERSDAPPRARDTFCHHDFGDIVAAACLAHDIGNPPFGHSGEDAIRSWFLDNKAYVEDLTDSQRFDLENFEGNAQGFRILTKLLHRPDEGGMQLTYAVLGAYSKYPRSSVSAREAGKRGKFGYTQDDADTFSKVAHHLGLKSLSDGSWSRHPLAFLVEAADDICYGIVDFEDGIKRGCIDRTRGHKLLRDLINSMGKEARLSHKTGALMDDTEYLRALSIRGLVYLASDAFSRRVESAAWSNFEPLLDSLGDSTRAILNAIKDLSKDKAYRSEKVLEVEAAGFEIIGGLLGCLVPAFLRPGGSKKSEKIQQLFRHLERKCGQEKNNYSKLLYIVDFVSGMTDSFALSRYRLLRGIDVPSS